MKMSVLRSFVTLLFVTLMLAAPITGSCRAAPPAPQENDPFAPYINAFAPPILRELENPAPAPPGVRVRRVVFRSRTVETAKGPVTSEIYALLAFPEGKGPFPALCVFHGGSGSAEENIAIGWAKRGYVAIAPDLPGIMDPKKAVNSSGWWKDLPYGGGRWTAAPDVTASTIFDAVVAGLQSFALLKAQPEVDTKRIGITGISWGGYMTTMLSGLLGDQVKAAFSVYGSGFYEYTVNGAPGGALAKMPAEERADWLKYLDAGRRAGGIRAPFFIAAATNDFFYWPPAVSATLAAIPGEKNHLFAPNVSHAVPLPGGTTDPHPGSWLAMEAPYFVYYLKGEGYRLPWAMVVPVGDDPLTVRFAVDRDPDHGSRITAAVWYSLIGPEWTKRSWVTVPATPGIDAPFSARLPDEARAGADWFAVITDERSITVSTPMTRIPPAPAASPAATK